jgi:hypothetical protein
VSYTNEELKRLIAPALIALGLLAAGAALVWWFDTSLAQARRGLAAAPEQRKQNGARLARIAEEEREVNANLALYRQLRELNVLGEERRLEWADAIARIRTQRELLDLRYRVERQRLLSAIPGNPANVEFYASTMQVDLALLHEEDLLRFLGDLRASGNAYYSVRRCGVRRTGMAATGATITPRLHADCLIDLITVVDKAAKG